MIMNLIGWIALIEIAVVFLTWKAAIWFINRNERNDYRETISLTCHAAAEYGQHSKAVWLPPRPQGWL